MTGRPSSIRALPALIIGGSMIAVLAGCTVGPNFLKPVTKMPEKYAEAP